MSLSPKEIAGGLALLGSVAEGIGTKLPAPFGLVGSIASLALGLASDLVLSGADATVELTRIRESHPLLNKAREDRKDWIEGMFDGDGDQ